MRSNLINRYGRRNYPYSEGDVRAPRPDLAPGGLQSTGNRPHSEATVEARACETCVRKRLKRSTPGESGPGAGALQRMDEGNRVVSFQAASGNRRFLPFLPRPPPWPLRSRLPQAGHAAFRPGFIAEGAAAGDALANGRRFRLRLRLIDPGSPLARQWRVGGNRQLGPASAAVARAVLHRPSSARSISPARHGFRSTYRLTVSRWSSSCTAGGLNQPW